MKGIYIFFIFVLIPLISGCVHVVPKQLREEVDPTLTFQQIFQNPSQYQGKTVIWGGDIIQTLNLRDGTTRIEVFERPLNWREEPKDTLSSGGRFLIRVEKYLDPYIYRRGMKITVAGVILGEETKPLGELDYRYPLLLSKQITLWEEYVYPLFYYDPWWGYPYGWGFPRGWYFRYHLH